MHLARMWIFAAVAAVAFLLAPSARASVPPFYVTFTTSQGSSPRIAGALLSTTSPATQHAGTAHIEIDDWLGSAGNIASFASWGAALEVKIEYTTADAHGQEVVNLVAKLSHAGVTKWAVTFTGGSANKVGQTLDLSFITEATFAPPNPKAAPATLPRTPPQIARVMAPMALASAHIETGYLHADKIPGDIKSGAHADDSAVTSLTFAITFPTASNGSSTGRPSVGVLTVKKALSASSAFGHAHTANTVISAVTLKFFQNVLGNDAARFAIALDQARVSADSTQVSAGVQVETIEFKLAKIRLTDLTNNTSGIFEATLVP